MASRVDEAFVLTRYAYRERDWVVVLLTRGAGQVRLVARRARGMRGGRGTVLEPLSRIRVSYFERPHSELGTLDEADLVRSAFALAADPPRWAAGQVVAELALTFCPPGQRGEAQFRLVDRCLERLLAQHDAGAVWHYAELWFLRLAGVFPELERCGVCGAALETTSRSIDPIERTFVCAEHRSGRVVSLSGAATRWLQTAARRPLEEVVAPAPGDALNWLVSLRQHYVDRDLKSTALLRSLL
jgi:DNA repair protein RecO